jgi:hypothetical protein
MKSKQLLTMRTPNSYNRTDKQLNKFIKLNRIESAKPSKNECIRIENYGKIGKIRPPKYQKQKTESILQINPGIEKESESQMSK